MPDYHKMYLHLFNEVTRAINILQHAQTTAEDMFISGTEAPIHLLPQPDSNPLPETIKQEDCPNPEETDNDTNSGK